MTTVPPSPNADPADGLPLIGPDAVEFQRGTEIGDILPTDGAGIIPLVGLGGSAGGISALGQFFDCVPADSNMAYVVVLHLSPKHHSTLPELLQRHSSIPVVAAHDGVRVEVNTVYVIPPGKHLTTVNGHLRLTDLQPQHGKRVAVDLFFRSLADTHGPQATAIVLSGADGDGAIGLKRIKERGGLTIAQDPGEAEYPSMPRAAIETGMVDWVLRVAEMPKRISEYHAREQRLELPSEVAPTSSPSELTAIDRETKLLEILRFLRAKTGRDFSYYKRATIVRRISRRMQVTGVETMDDYLTSLRTQPGEAAALVCELLISVTNFFRDRDSFDALDEHIARLFAEKSADQAVRVWVVACATGEEAYSMAMLLLEHAADVEHRLTLQVFACDLDEEAIRFARAGVYPETISADVSQERLHRFFTKVPEGYMVRREVREMVLFATHDVLKDAPFSRVDLLSCRNLLIYLNREAQARCFEIFNFALRPDGVLFLGSSETVPDDSPLFETVDKRHRLYRQRAGNRIGLPFASEHGESALHRALHKHERTKLMMSPVAERMDESVPRSAADAAPSPSPALAPPAYETHFRLLTSWGPPSVLVDSKYNVVHLSDNAHVFLHHPEGEPTRDLLRLVHPAFRAPLRSALLTAEDRSESVEVSAISADGRAVDIRVAPGGEAAPGYFLVLFTAHDRDESHARRIALAAPDDATSALADQLERQLADARFRLQSTVEHYEISAEELKASNEELQAMNEELRSASEELESGREELQSVNEELTTLNVEFKGRVDELGRANSDLRNLMSATQIATVFLDREMRIMRYTPSAEPLFNFIAGDIGRPISDLKQQLEYPALVSDAEQVLASLVPVEREIVAGSAWLMVRVLPYRTVDDYIAGVVLTFIDITERKTYESALHASEGRLQTLADAIPQVVWTNDREGRAIYFNRRWYEYSGCSEEQSVGPGWMAIVHPDDSAPAIAQWQRALAANEIFDCEYRLRRFDGTYRWFLGRNVPTHRDDGQVDGWFGTATDIEDLKTADAALRESEEQFRRAVEDAPFPVIMQTEDGQVIQLSREWTALTGYTREDLPDFASWLKRANGPGADHLRNNMYGLFEGSASILNAEFDVLTRAGKSRRWIFAASAPGELRDGRKFIVGMVSDITERRLAEEQLDVSRELLRLIIENARDYAIISMDVDRRVTSWSAGAFAILGFTEVEAIGMSADVIFTPEDRSAGAPQAEAGTALAEGRASDERWHVRKDGHRFWGSGAMMAMHDSAGQTRGLVKIFRDQTEQMQAKATADDARAQLHLALQDAEAARDAAEAAGKAKDRFLAILSHELRAPLTPVLLSAQLLGRNPALGAEERETVAIIERNIRTQTHLIDDLLDISRLVHGKMELAFELVDLHDILTRAVEISSPDFQVRDQVISVHLDAVNRRVRGDSERLHQVFWNILKNASKFSAKGSEVVLRTLNRGEQVVTTVSDSGIGFEPSFAEQLFVPFEQGSEQVTRRFGGLGLGLAIAEATVSAHGGTIDASSEGPGLGATFTVSLALASESQADSADQVSPARE